MKADELMRALRSNAEVNTHAAAMIMAADCIEEQQAQLDMAVADLTLTNTRKINVTCDVCKHLGEVCAPVDLQDICHNWQWRGVQEGEGGSKQ